MSKTPYQSDRKENPTLDGLFCFTDVSSGKKGNVPGYKSHLILSLSATWDFVRKKTR